ncbi:MAG: 6-carboxytetrahydropterin synthase [Pseudonocardia sp.]
MARCAGSNQADPARRTHGHDFTARFRFEAATLTYLGVVVDDDVRDEITRHVRDRLAYRDLDRLHDRPPAKRSPNTSRTDSCARPAHPGTPRSEVPH